MLDNKKSLLSDVCQLQVDHIHDLIQHLIEHSFTQQRVWASTHDAKCYWNSDFVQSMQDTFLQDKGRSQSQDDNRQE
jgi:hypothetical protein